jgi:hypothetical protein
MLPGDDIYEQVDRGIRLWDKVLLCCSRHSTQVSSGKGPNFPTLSPTTGERVGHPPKNAN